MDSDNQVSLYKIYEGSCVILRKLGEKLVYVEHYITEIFKTDKKAQAEETQYNYKVSLNASLPLLK